MKPSEWAAPLLSLASAAVLLAAWAVCRFDAFSMYQAAARVVVR